MLAWSWLAAVAATAAIGVAAVVFVALYGVFAGLFLVAWFVAFGPGADPEIGTIRYGAAAVACAVAATVAAFVAVFGTDGRMDR